MGKNAIIWFRKGLRLHDNPALLEACKDAVHVYPVFVIDPFFLVNNSYKVGVNRYNFLLESLRDLDASFIARGSRLLVLRGKPEEVLPRAFKDWNIDKLCFELDTEPYAKFRDGKIKELARAAGVEVYSPVSHTLYDTDTLVRRNGGRAPLSMGGFVKLLASVGPPPSVAPDAPDVIPPPDSTLPGAGFENTDVPTWESIGYKEAPTTPFKGGEKEALRRLEASMRDGKWVASFSKPETNPAAFDEPATTVLSPYLKFGCLSPRLFHTRLLSIYAKHRGHTTPPQSLEGQLLWREFFYTVGANTPSFDRMVGNPICRQIGWEDNEAFLEAWRDGRTGYPWIDAIMIQLKEWGWMHHLARHSVACFLTRGDLYVSWEKGKEVFDELLIDADHYLNTANWLWLSASAFLNQYFRVYSPITFGKKYDPDGKFIRKFIPALKDFPAKFIYEPWKAPIEAQRRSGCIIGKHYPHPIVDHAVVHKTNMAKIKQAFGAAKPSVKEEDDGSDNHSDGEPPRKKTRKT
eukprot:Opistho-2@7955